MNILNQEGVKDGEMEGGTKNGIKWSKISRKRGGVSVQMFKRGIGFSHEKNMREI